MCRSNRLSLARWLLPLLASACDAEIVTTVDGGQQLVSTIAVGSAAQDDQSSEPSHASKDTGPREQPLHAPPEELFLVTRVVDGDTIHIERAGVVEKLRLLSVDTEEVIRGGGNTSGTKPQTTFGTQCAEWAVTFFEALADEGGETRVGLWFPNDSEARDIYGRLLCHVVLADGTDFNLLLLEEGKSPYFNKYGNSLEFDAEFRAAQAAAREAKLGIWDPETNQSKTPDTPSVKRPYEVLMPWWEARARAIDELRSKRAKDPMRYVDAGDPDQLEAVTRAKSPEPAMVEVFGAPDRVFDEKDGSQTVLFRTSDRGRALRVRIPKEAIGEHAELELGEISEELRQNYVWVKGPLRWTGRGYEFTSGGPETWRVADPQGQN